MTCRHLLIVALGTALMLGACDGSDDPAPIRFSFGGGTAAAGGGGGGSGGSAAGGGAGGSPGVSGRRDGGVVVKDAGVFTEADGGTALVLPEAQAAAVMSSVNAGEIQLAQAVLQRLTDPDVRGFAQKMISEHKALQAEANNLMAQRGLVPESNPISDALESATEQLIMSLSSLSGRELESAYVQSQVMMHRQALTLIDCVIGPALNDSMLTLFVTERVRPGVTEHLQTAATLAASLGADVPVDTINPGPSQCDLTCIPHGAGGLLPEQLRIVACPP